MTPYTLYWHQTPGVMDAGSVSGSDYSIMCVYMVFKSMHEKLKFTLYLPNGEKVPAGDGRFLWYRG